VAIGSQYHILFQKPLTRFLIRLFGTFDVHSHYRVKPLLKWARNQKEALQSKTIVEVGCGPGMNLLELSHEAGETSKLVGFDLNGACIEEANRLTKKLGLTNVSFYAQDCSSFAFEEKVDVVLLIDFLEHLHDPTAFLADLNKIVKDTTVLVVSVPTHLYSKVFGQKFHEDVGHLHDGFNKEELQEMLKEQGFTIVDTNYNTGPVASIACYLYYNLFSSVDGRVKNLVGLAMSPLRLFDWFNGPTRSSSLFVIAKRENSGGRRLEV
jgi:2-polyprenyl-3-methyl-5-hydroxy-6-metoxy-1,4-benzoquinol methylase